MKVGLNVAKTHQDLSGKKFGRLTVISRERRCDKGDYWLCRCDCGNEKIIRCDALINGRTKSCGCLNKEIQRMRNTKHGLCRSKIYSVYYGMHQRCENEKDSKYQYYGKRGITVCKEWSGVDGFACFYEWAINNGYREKLTIDRMDNGKGYSPDNCRWVTRQEQSDNLRRTIKITVDNKEMTLKEASEKYKISKRIIYRRLRNGWKEEDSVKTPKLEKYKNKRYL